jgi:hypothetical protein
LDKHSFTGLPIEDTFAVYLQTKEWQDTIETKYDSSRNLALERESIYGSSEKGVDHSTKL